MVTTRSKRARIVTAEATCSMPKDRIEKQVSQLAGHCAEWKLWYMQRSMPDCRSHSCQCCQFSKLLGTKSGFLGVLTAFH